MGVFDNFPYTNNHELNLDWIIKQTKKVLKASDEIAANTEIAATAAENAQDAYLDSRNILREVTHYYNQILTVGSPLLANSASDMYNEDRIYLYTGNEEGYTFGHWYYYDGAQWADGGEYGSGGAITPNANNILKYILEKVAYTETGMDTYVNALYQALAQAGGGGTTTYMIINVLTNVTNSNDATGVDEGESYTATLTPDTDYTIDSVVITMGGVDVTSTVYSNGEINIASVTGDVVITASATLILVPEGYTKVDYISSNVSGSPSASKLTTTPYIKTGFPSVDTDILNYTVKLVYECNFNTVTAIPFGGRNGDSNSNTTRGCVLNLGSSDTVLNYGNIASQTALIRSATDSAISLNEKHTVILKDGNVSLDGTQVIQTGATSAIQLSTYKWGLFGRNNLGRWDVTTSGGDLSPMIGKIYEFSIADANGDYVLRYIPCKRNSDNVYGMFDTVSQTFHTSAISTGFVGGND